MRHFNLITIVLFVVVVVAGSCRERPPAPEQQTIPMHDREVIRRGIEENVYPLPTSAEVVRLLTDLDMGFIIGVTNPVDNVSRYITSRSRAINMGIYGADLSYATLYNMQQEVIDYLNAIRILANELNMGHIYDEDIYDQITENFDDRDKLVEILTAAYEKTYSQLVDNDQEALALLVVGGAWIEGMYLTTHISESTYHVEGIVRVLMEQKRSFDLLLDVARPLEDHPMIKSFLEELQPIKKAYEDVTTSLTERQVEAITAAIAEVRESVTN